MAKRLQIIGDFPSGGTVDPSEIERIVDEHIHKEDTLNDLAAEVAKLVTIEPSTETVSLLIDGVNHAVDNVSDPEATGTEDEYSLEIN